MRYFFTTFILCCALLCAAQTQQIEEAYINKQIVLKAISPEEATLKVKEYRRILKELGGYPQLPFDTLTNDFKFEYFLDVPGVSKSMLMKRIKEWCAINYVELSAVSKYEDLESGKFILKGYVRLPFRVTYEWLFGKYTQSYSDFKAYHTISFTVKDGRVKYRIESLTYMLHVPGKMVGNTYLPAVDVEYPLRSQFPLISGETSNLINQFELIHNTVTAFDASRGDLLRYLLNWQEDYKF